MRRLNFLTNDEVKALHDPAWLVRDIIPSEAIAMVYGVEGSHKTFLVIDMALCVATGTAFHGHAVQQGRVIYVAAEGGPRMRRRIEAWEHEHDKDAKDCTWLLEPVLLDSDDDAANLIENIEALGIRPRLVIFDTLNWCMQGEENSSKDMARVLRTTRKLVETFGCSVILVHHPPKANANTHRGSGALSGGLHTNIRVEFDGMITTMECLKQKDAKAFDSMTFARREVRDSLVMEKVERSRTNRTSNDTQGERERTILGIAKDRGPLAKQELKDLAMDARIPQSAAYKIIKELEERSLLVLNDQRLLEVA